MIRARIYRSRSGAHTATPWSLVIYSPHGKISHHLALGYLPRVYRRPTHRAALRLAIHLLELAQPPESPTAYATRKYAEGPGYVRRMEYATGGPIPGSMGTQLEAITQHIHATMEDAGAALGRALTAQLKEARTGRKTP